MEDEKDNEREREREKGMRLPVERTEVWNKRGYATTSETGPHTGKSRVVSTYFGRNPKSFRNWDKKTLL